VEGSVINVGSDGFPPTALVHETGRMLVQLIGKEDERLSELGHQLVGCFTAVEACQLFWPTKPIDAESLDQCRRKVTLLRDVLNASER